MPCVDSVDATRFGLEFGLFLVSNVGMNTRVKSTLIEDNLVQISSNLFSLEFRWEPHSCNERSSLHPEGIL